MRGTARAEAFRAYEASESWWLDAYVTFRAIHAANDERAWWDWTPALAFADPAAVRDASTALGEERRYRAYLQWIAEGQWRASRAAAGVRVFGDLPFMVSGDSPDVWTRRQEFMLDATVGVPPDAFSDSGQDWGLPPWRWTALQATGFQWMRARARRTAALFDGVRIDHLVGLYRVYVRPTDETQPKVFAPPDERTQSQLGATLLGIYLASGVEVVAEDLGTVPDFVRWSMARLGVPGFKVLRWERAWREEGEPLLDPAAYPELSVALSGTHDTEAMTEWWADGAGATQGVAAQRVRAAGPTGRGRAVRARGSRCGAENAAGERVALRHVPVAGRVRLDHARQHAGDGERRQLDVARAGADGRVARVAGVGGARRRPGGLVPRLEPDPTPGVGVWHQRHDSCAGPQAYRLEQLQEVTSTQIAPAHRARTAHATCHRCQTPGTG